MARGGTVHHPGGAAPAQVGAEPIVTVVVPAHNEAATLPACLSAILAAVAGMHSPDRVEILVVDDGSTDGTAATARRCLDGRGLVVSQENRGRAATRARGLAAARGEWVFMVDAHCRVDSGSLRWWETAYDANCVSGRAFNGDVSIVRDTPFADFWDAVTAWGWRSYLARREPVCFGVDDFDRYPKGSGMFLAPARAWRDAYQKTQLLSATAITHVSDDTRLLRAMAENYRICLDPAFRGSYHSPRNTLLQFTANARYRGATFVDGYHESPSAIGAIVRSAPYAVPAGTLAATLGVARARATTRVALAVGAAFMALPAGVVFALATHARRPPGQRLRAAAVAPAFAAAFSLGLAQGYVDRWRSSRGTRN